VTVSRGLRISGLVVGVSALALALIPFHAGLAIHGGVGPVPRLVSSCGWAIGDVSRDETSASFGYISGQTGAVTVPGHVGCAREARRRLVFSGAGLVLAVALGGIALVLDRRRRLLGDTGPQLAT